MSVVFDASSSVIFALAGPLVMHNFVGNYVEPKLFGNKFEMHPVTVLCALVFWGLLWGISGAILAVPLTAALHIGLKDLDHPFAKAASCFISGKLGSLYKYTHHREPTIYDRSSANSMDRDHPLYHSTKGNAEQSTPVGFPEANLRDRAGRRATMS